MVFRRRTYALPVPQCTLCPLTTIPNTKCTVSSRVFLYPLTVSERFLEIIVRECRSTVVVSTKERDNCLARRTTVVVWNGGEKVVCYVVA